MARRYGSLHHNLQDGQNVVFHREHRSKKGRSKIKPGRLQKWDRSDRRIFKKKIRREEFLKNLVIRKPKSKKY